MHCKIAKFEFALRRRYRTRRKQSRYSIAPDPLGSDRKIWMCLVCFKNVQWKRVCLPVLQAALVSTGHSKHSNGRGHLGPSLHYQAHLGASCTNVRKCATISKTVLKEEDAKSLLWECSVLESLSTCLASSTFVSTGHSKHSNCRGHLGSSLRYQAHLGASCTNVQANVSRSLNRPTTSSLLTILLAQTPQTLSQNHQTVIALDYLALLRSAWRHRLYQVPLYHGTASFLTFPGHLVKILTCECRNGMAAMGSRTTSGLF